MHSLVFHEDKVEGTVEECVDEIREAEVEDEQIGDCSHPPMIWKLKENVTKNRRLKLILLRMTIHKTAVFPTTAVMIMKVKAKFQKCTKELTIWSLLSWRGQGTAAWCSSCS